MEQVLCWSKTEPDFEPNLAGAFTGIINSDAGVNLLGPSAYIDSPRKVSGFQGIEFEAYLREAGLPKSIRTLLWATSGNVWHVTFFFITGYPKGEATVEAVFNSVELEGEARSTELYGNVPEQPGFLPRGVDRLLIQVTLEGKVYLNGSEASLDDVRQELRRLAEVNGIVLYDRAGGHSPPPEAEAVSAEILFAIGFAGVEIHWLNTSQE
jgi:hypothetical protein